MNLQFFHVFFFFLLTFGRGERIARHNAGINSTRQEGAQRATEFLDVSKEEGGRTAAAAARGRGAKREENAREGEA